MPNNGEWYKNNPDDVISWWDSEEATNGEWLFTFDGTRIYNMFRDYPHNMTAEQVEIFDKENPYWAEFFKDRK